MGAPYVVYLLYSLHHLFRLVGYIGMTNDFYTRFRAHNGCVSGGADTSTEQRPFGCAAILSGFTSETEAVEVEDFLIRNSPPMVNDDDLKTQLTKGKKAQRGQFTPRRGLTANFVDALAAFRNLPEKWSHLTFTEFSPVTIAIGEPLPSDVSYWDKVPPRLLSSPHNSKVHHDLVRGGIIAPSQVPPPSEKSATEDDSTSETEAEEQVIVDVVPASSSSAAASTSASTTPAPDNLLLSLTREELHDLITKSVSGVLSRLRLES